MYFLHVGERKGTTKLPTGSKSNQISMFLSSFLDSRLIKIFKNYLAIVTMFNTFS